MGDVVIWDPSSSVVFERDLWVAKGLAEMRQLVRRRGLIVPDRIAIGVGETSLGSTGRRALGECWPSTCSPHHNPRIVISDLLTDPFEILATLVHELVHAADDCDDGHGAWFKSWAKALGLKGCPSTRPSQGLLRTLQPTVTWLGPYPAAGTGFVVSDTEGILV